MPASTLSPQAVQRAPHCPICKRTIEVRRLKRDNRFWTCDGCMVAWIETHPMHPPFAAERTSHKSAR